MRLAFDESLDYLRLKGVITSDTWTVEGVVDAAVGLKLYAAFQIIVKAHLHSLSALFIHFKEDDGDLLLSIYVETEEKISLKREILEVLPPKGVAFTEIFEEMLCIRRFSISKAVMIDV